VTSPSKRKGDKAELEAAVLLNHLLGVDTRRKLGAGRLDDTGDIDGVPDTVVQVVNRADAYLATALRAKPLGAEAQRINAGVTFAATMVRLRGGGWRFVLTPEQFATFWREATSPP
jgi:hypothetical protein